MYDRRQGTRWATTACMRGLLVAVCIGLVGCGSGSSGSGSGQYLRLGTTTTLTSLNPFVVLGAQGPRMLQTMYPSLVYYDRGGQDLTGDLASSWTHSADAKAWTFELRPGAKWSDGKPLTADDVAWTINTVVKFQDGSTGALAGGVQGVTEAVAKSPTKLVVRFATPAGNALARLQLLPILPRHVWAEHAGGDGSGMSSFRNDAPVVSGGPFKLVTFRKDEIALFERNPNWYGPKPKIERFGVEFFSNDDALVAALKHGDIDAVQTAPTTAIDSLKSDYTVVSAPGQQFDEIILNPVDRPAHPELRDPRVRKALDTAIDRDRIVRDVWAGYAEPGASIIAPALKHWNDASIQPMPFDLDAANRLLDEAGYKRGADGVRLSRQGQPMAYDVIFPKEEEGPPNRTFAIVQSDWAKIGVKITQQKMDNGAAFDAILAPDGKYLDYNMALWGWVAHTDPDYMLSVFTCGQRGNLNDAGYCDPAYDRLYEQQATERDPQRRLATVKQMQRMIFEARPYLVLNYRGVVEVWAKGWTGWTVTPQGTWSEMTKQTLLDVHKQS